MPPCLRRRKKKKKHGGTSGADCSVLGKSLEVRWII